MQILKRIEHRYRLPDGYFKAKLPHRARATSGPRIRTLSAPEQRRLAWHLPDDFHSRPFEEQEEILGWVNSVVISGSTDYRRFQAAAMRQRYAVRFRNLEPSNHGLARATAEPELDETDDVNVEAASGVADAPAALEREMADLLRFKTQRSPHLAINETASGVRRPHPRRSNILD